MQHAGRSLECSSRRDVDNAAPFGLAHVWRDGPAHPKGADDVDFVDAPPVVDRLILERARMQLRRNRSIVDQDVERPECANRLLNPRSDARVVAHVDRGRTDVRELMSEVLSGILMSLRSEEHTSELQS